MKKEELKISVKNRQFKAKLRCMSFKEGESFIMYIPSLELSAYGDTEEEAHEMMREVLRVLSQDFFALTQAEVDKILKDLGWNKNKIFNKKRVHLSQTTFDDIKQLFNLPSNTIAKQVPIEI